ncbi:MAG: 16S rRNA (guanine(966)-N(2))-methyltransferase RsmD [Gammaproteobacteria bacterium]|nr:16S rRNA (guanine(966)-N(2))-methyltransferase RsmD [Gammaproteobacteria bacterium]
MQSQPGQIRIIGGKWRGRKLKVLDTPELRPTPNRIRETLFNWLMFDIKDAVCLDAFAGTGALGFEALSRGAQHVSFCELSSTIVEELNKNTVMLECAKAVTVLQQNFLTANFNQQFDIIFLDPPFHQNLVTDCLERARQLLVPGGLVYVEAEANYQLAADFPILKSQKAGNVSYYLLQYQYGNQDLQS